MTRYIGIEGTDLAGVALLAVVVFAGACQHPEAPVTFGDIPDIELTEVLRIGDEAEGDSLWFEQVGGDWRLIRRGAFTPVGGHHSGMSMAFA
ncbi:MAG: hypothetical protein F4058_00900 [Rhodothermaceae bacterium]|nr:hypothetical protein [Rhodothermaceae bacterium]MYI83869.1 hypothetical protein [Rhodothermaceae bacterium]